MELNHTESSQGGWMVLDEWPLIVSQLLQDTVQTPWPKSQGFLRSGACPHLQPFLLLPSPFMLDFIRSSINSIFVFHLLVLHVLFFLVIFPFLSFTCPLCLANSYSPLGLSLPSLLPSSRKPPSSLDQAGSHFYAVLLILYLSWHLIITACQSSQFVVGSSNMETLYLGAVFPGLSSISIILIKWICWVNETVKSRHECYECSSDWSISHIIGSGELRL